ncbi:hypothetical protein IB238_20555 [Rhizobium sp. ARZ01]|uniref:hypothetical protein n=1 Tax=Rhizobium sp. ARZ01 TaxID=2769313 RepID=UPI00177D9317|nr:hypothetical protein [Rhizobium sp. ARZ01]MBD9375020.1 hypothetical protein [Rhizobium sp. ARZ01]
MLWLPLVFTVYFAVALFFFVCTYFEGTRRIPAWDLHRVIGLAASTIWPLVIAYVWIFRAEGTAVSGRAYAADVIGGEK